MTVTTEDTELLRLTVAYVTQLYQELSGENGAPTLGTQNQVVDFILADPELCAAVAAWGNTENTEEASLAPPRRLPCDAVYRRIRDYMASVMETPIFARNPHYSP
jgi:hypothetical protein